MEADILIIGGGIVGATVAFHASADRKVVILEAEDQPGYHATGRSAALFTETYGNTTIRALTAGSREFIVSPPEGFSDIPLCSPRGELLIAQEADLPRLDAILAGVPAASVRERIVRLSGDEARKIVPSLKSSAVDGALHDPGVVDLDVAALHQGYLRGLARNHGRVVTGARVEAISRRTEGWQVETSAGSFSAPIIVNAAGAWADRVGALAGATTIGIQPMRRTALLIDPPAGMETGRWPMVVDAAETFYLKPDAGLLLASPADETPSDPVDAQPEELDVAIAVDRIETAFDISVKRVRRKWAGLRSFVHDRSPVLGYDARVEGFFWAAALGGYGVQTSPAVGRVAAALLERGVLPSDLQALGLEETQLAPARFA